MVGAAKAVPRSNAVGVRGTKKDHTGRLTDMGFLTQIKGFMESRSEKFTKWKCKLTGT